MKKISVIALTLLFILSGCSDNNMKFSEESIIAILDDDINMESKKTERIEKYDIIKYRNKSELCEYQFAYLDGVFTSFAFLQNDGVAIKEGSKEEGYCLNTFKQVLKSDIFPEDFFKNVTAGLEEKMDDGNGITYKNYFIVYNEITGGIRQLDKDNQD